MRDIPGVTSARSEHDAILPGEAAPQRGKLWARRMWNVGRVIAAIAIIMHVYTQWAPQVIFQGRGCIIAPDDPCLELRSYTLHLGPGDVDPMLGTAIASGMGMLLLVFALGFWQRTRPDLALFSALTFCGLLGIIMRIEPNVPLMAGEQGADVRLLAPHGTLYLTGRPVAWLPGAPLSLAALVLLGVAGVLLGASCAMLWGEFQALDRSRLKERAQYSSSARRACRAGILLWALGALVLPWRAGGCAQLPLVAQHCVPGGVGDVLQRGLSGDPALLNPRLGMYALPALLIYLALFALAGLWRRIPPRLLAAWMGLWLGGSAVALAFATRGILLSRPVALGPGLFVALVGLLVAACGLAWLLSNSLTTSPEAPDLVALL